MRKMNRGAGELGTSEAHSNTARSNVCNDTVMGQAGDGVMEATGQKPDRQAGTLRQGQKTVAIFQD